MSVASIEQFYQEVLQDSTLQAQFQSAPTNEAIAKIAVDLGQEKGYNFSTTELKEWLSEQQTVAEEGELKDEYLESVAGGAGKKRSDSSLGAFRGT